MDRQSAYRFGAAAVLIAASAFELGRIATNIPWAGLEPWISHAASGALSLLFLGTAASILLAASSRRAAIAASTLGLFTPAVMMSHGFVTRVAGTPLGLVYVAAAGLVIFLGVRAARHTAAPPWRRDAGLSRPA